MAIRDVINARAIGAYWASVQGARDPYLLEGFMPREKKISTDLSWFKGSGGAPVSLMPSAYGAKTTFRNRIPVTRIETEMPYFKEGFRLSENDRRTLNKAADSGDPVVQEVMARVFADADNLVAGADVVAERMRASLLFPVSGNVTINFATNGVDYSYNYDPSGEWKASNYVALSGTALWSAPTTANPLDDMLTLLDLIAKSAGEDGRYVAMSAGTFSAMRQTTAVINALAAPIATVARVREMIRDEFGMELIVYNKVYRDENNVTRQFVPDGYVTVLPEGNVGRTVYAQTPEESDLMTKQDVDVEIIGEGVAISTYTENDPVNTYVKASECVLPSYERMDGVATLKVL